MKKRIISLIIVLSLVFCSTVTVFAIEELPEMSFEEMDIIQCESYILYSNNVSMSKAPSIVTDNFDKSEIRPNGVGSITVKILLKVMKKYRNKIIKAVSKINKNWGTKLAKKYDSLLNYLKTAKGGVESVLTKGLQKIGFSKSTAELIADTIITIASWLF